MGKILPFMIIVCVALSACSRQPDERPIQTAVAQTVVAATVQAREFGTCGTKLVLDAKNKIHDILARWSDADQVANSTARIALAGPVTNLQTIRREFEALSAPPCMKQVMFYYSTSLDSTIQGYIAFMGKSADVVVNGHIETASSYMSKGTNAMQEIMACAPDCP